jgi:hypothetical protein
MQEQTSDSKTMQTKSNTYYFDVRQAKNGTKYLTITETRTKDGQKFRSTITIFGNNMEEFNTIFAEMAEKVKS